MAVAPVLLDLKASIPALREQLARFLPVELKDCLNAPDGPAEHDQRAIHTHLTQLLTALSAMVPRWLLDAISDHGSTDARGLEATLLLADLTGSTSLTSQLETFGRIGNEYITHALNRCFAAVVPIALARNGDLLAFGGDAILVAFDDADHAMTAAVAAWEMQQAMASLSLDDLDLPDPPRLQMKIGLASGPLVLASVGTNFRRVALPLGRVLDTADAMANEPGHIRLDACAAVGAAPIADLAPQSDGSALLMRLRDTPSLPPERSSVAISASIGDLVTHIATLAPYLPQSVLASLVAAPHAMPGYGEQRHVVNLFSHLAGLHALADSLWSKDPRLVAEVADLALKRALALIEGHSGVLARVDIYPKGHKLLALFGAPVAHEQEAERAILAALALRDTMSQTDDEIAAWLGARERSAAGLFSADQPGLTLRSGINAGPVVAGLVGSPLRWEYTVMGDAVNVGARLMSKAQPGEVLASAGVAAVMGDLLDGAVHTLLLKGKPEPVPAWSIRALHHVDRSSPLQDMPLVGRESERQTFRGIAEALRSGVAGVVFVQGEAGIGKTRLVRELPAILGPDITYVRTGSPGLVPVSFGLFRALLAELCRTTLGDSMPPDVEQLRLIVEQLCPGRVAELWPTLAVLTGVSNADQTTLGATAEAQQRILAWAVQSVLAGGAVQSPLVWICEDLHEADDASLAVLEQLLTIGWNAPILLCATLRTTAATTQIAHRLVETAVRQFQSNATLIELAGLNPTAGDTLIDSLLPGLAPATREALHAHATGNPLFLQTLAQTVRQQRLLVASSQGLALRGSLASLDIPRTLRELVAAQVDRLPAEVRRLAQVAAVIAVADRTVPLWLLEQIADERRTVEPRLRALEQAQVIQAETTEPTPRYTFRHALYQQAAYDQLLERERRELHRRAGLALHDRRDRQEARVEALAYHCYEGQLRELAVDYSLAAGQRALRAYANRDARRLLRRAQGLTRRLGRVEQEADAREGLGELYLRHGRFAPARAQLECALEYASAFKSDPVQLEAAIRRHRLMAVIAEFAGEYDQAEVECQAGLTLARNQPSGSSQLPRLYEQLAVILMRRGMLQQAEQACRDGLTALPPDPVALRERVDLLLMLGTLDGQRGNYHAAIPVLEHSLSLARSIANPAMPSVILCNLGVCFYYIGQRERALACYRESLSIDERTGRVAEQLRMIDNIGLLHLMNGDYDSALHCFLDCCQRADSLNIRQILANATTNIGLLYFMMGDHEQAKAHLLRSYALFSELGDSRSLIECLYRLGDVSLAENNPELALQYGEQALTYAQQVGSASYESCALRVIGEAFLAQQQIDEATAYLDRARQTQARVDDPFDQVLLLRATAYLALAKRDRQEAVRLAQSALHLARAQAVPYLIAIMEEVSREIGVA